jgi:hypothetical protein
VNSPVQIHIDEVLNAGDFTVLHADIGVALMDRGLYEKAEQIFLDLSGEEEVSMLASRMVSKAVTDTSSTDGGPRACGKSWYLPAQFRTL